MAKRTSTQQKHNAIRADFKKMSEERTKQGKRKFTSAFIVSELSKKYFLSEGTIENVVYS